MPVTFEVLQTGQNLVNDDSFSTAAFDVEAGDFILFVELHTKVAAENLAFAVDHAGLGATWESMGGASNIDTERTKAHGCIVPSNTNGAITWSYRQAGVLTVVEAVAWAVLRVGGAGTLAGAAAALRQWKIAQGSGNSPTVTFDSVTLPSSAIVAVVMGGAAVTGVPASGWTEQVDQNYNDSGSAVAVQWIGSRPDGVDIPAPVTFSNSTGWGIVALEFATASVAGAGSPMWYYERMRSQ